MLSGGRCRCTVIISKPATFHIIKAVQPATGRFFSSTSNNMTTPSQSPATPRPKEIWSPAKYLAFNNERMLPALDLVHSLAKYDMNGKRIVDLGCGPGNSTQAIASTWSGAKVTGMDSSESMLERARADVDKKAADGVQRLESTVDFEKGDLRTWTPANHDENPVDLFFSNAAFHWLRTPERIPAMLRLFRAQKPGGVFAFQVPDNYNEPSHALMREVALLPNRPWTEIFLDAGVGYHKTLPRRLLLDHGGAMASRPDIDPIEPAEEYYDAFAPYASEVRIWNTTYRHVLPSSRHVVAWVEGSGLMPYLGMLPAGTVRDEFREEYLARIARAYLPMYDGKVMLRYPRRFLVAQRK